MQVKQFCETPFELKDLDDEAGVFTGYASVFGVVDRVGDIVAAGAFNKSLRAWTKSKKLPRMFWQHDSCEPLGVFTAMTEDAKGLIVEGQLALGTQRGREARELIKMGALDSLSIGYRPVKWKYDESTDIRTLTEIDLVEVSLVSMPANEQAEIASVKSITSMEPHEQKRELERILRDAGFSRKQSGAFISAGLDAALRDAGDAEEPDQRDADAELVKSLERLAASFSTQQTEE